MFIRDINQSAPFRQPGSGLLTCSCVYLRTHAALRTFDASDVTADVLVKPVGVDLLLVEVGQVLLEDIVRRPVGLAQVLHELERREIKMISQ